VEHGPLNVVPLADGYADLLVVHASCNMPRDETRRALTPGGRAFILKGTQMEALPAEPLFNGLCVNREARVLVTLTDGRIVCFGK